MTHMTESTRNDFVAFNVRPVDSLLVVIGALMLALDAAGVTHLGIIANFGKIGSFRYVLLTIAIMFALAYGIELAVHVGTALRRHRVLREGLAVTGRIDSIGPAASAFNFPLHWFGHATRYVVVFKSEMLDANPRLHRTRAIPRSKIGNLSVGDAIDIRCDPKYPESAFWVGEG